MGNLRNPATNTPSDWPDCACRIDPSSPRAINDAGLSRSRMMAACHLAGGDRIDVEMNICGERYRSHSAREARTARDQHVIPWDNVPLPSLGIAGSRRDARMFERTSPIALVHPFSSLELDRTRLKYIRTLGQGAFGDVFLAECKPLGLPCQQSGAMTSYGRGNDVIQRDVTSSADFVAVKVLYDSVSRDALKSLEREAKMLMWLSHANLIRLLGVCWNSQPRCLVYEWMEIGDLKEFLWTCTPYYDQGPGECVQDTLNVPRPSTPSLDFAKTEVPSLSTRDVVLIGVQIATGMEYLGNQGWVHRDLAARNILVGRGRVVKIADFGMARMVDPGSGTYLGSSKEDIPIRWCAPECINKRLFSSASDVWSFGVVLWEVFSLGIRPYLGLSHAEVATLVSSGSCLESPPAAPARVYGLMKSCWAMDGAERPSFEAILQFLGLCRY